MMITEPEEILAGAAEALGRTLTSYELLRETISGDGIIRGYRVELSDAAGATHQEILYLQTSPERTDQDGVLVFQNAETDDEVAVWLYPADPALPALQTAVYPQAAAVMLQKMGIAPQGIELDLVAYRPGRRAVVRVTTEERALYLKAVRPVQVAELHELYAEWSDAGLPVPETLGWTPEGLLGFSALSGSPALDHPSALGGGFLDSLETLIQQYAKISTQRTARTSLAERVNWYAQRASARTPELSERLALLADSISQRRGQLPPPIMVNVHGDLHLGQVFIDPQRPDDITGVLDIDTAGLGDPADDAGALYAHLMVSSFFEVVRESQVELQQTPSEPEEMRSVHFAQLAEAWKSRWHRIGARNNDAGFVGRSGTVAAAHLLAHTLGDFVPPQQLLDTAEALLDEDENSLT